MLHNTSSVPMLLQSSECQICFNIRTEFLKTAVHQECHVFISEMMPWCRIIFVLPYEQVLSSVGRGVLENRTLTGQPFGESTSKRGREMAFFIIGEMGGGGGERSLEPPRGRSGVLRTCRRVREKKLSLFSEAVMESPSPLFPAPPWLLRNEVSPNTSPPRPTCMVWRKSPSGGLIISGVRSPLKRRLPDE